MNGIEALKALQQGKRVRRPNWDNEEYIYAKIDDETGRWELYNERDDVEDCFIDIRDFLDPNIYDWEIVNDWIEDENGVPTCRYCDWSFLQLDMHYIKSFNYCPKCGKRMK